MGAIWRDSGIQETDFWVCGGLLKVEAIAPASARMGSATAHSCLNLDRIQLFFDEGMEGM
jgi:hypothetical protein